MLLRANRIVQYSRDISQHRGCHQNIPSSVSLRIRRKLDGLEMKLKALISPPDSLKGMLDNLLDQCDQNFILVLKWSPVDTRLIQLEVTDSIRALLAQLPMDLSRTHLDLDQEVYTPYKRAKTNMNSMIASMISSELEVRMCYALQRFSYLQTVDEALKHESSMQTSDHVIPLSPMPISPTEPIRKKAHFDVSTLDLSTKLAVG